MNILKGVVLGGSICVLGISLSEGWALNCALWGYLVGCLVWSPWGGNQ